MQPSSPAYCETGPVLRRTSGLAPSKTRQNEPTYYKIIGDIVSHQTTKSNIVTKGLVIYTGQGIKITNAGREFFGRGDDFERTAVDLPLESGILRETDRGSDGGPDQ